GLSGIGDESQQFTSFEDGDSQFPGSDHFRYGFLNGGGYDHQISAGADPAAVLLKTADAHLFEFIAGFIVHTFFEKTIGAADVLSRSFEVLRQRAHAGSGNADEKDMFTFCYVHADLTGIIV